MAEWGGGGEERGRGRGGRRGGGGKEMKGRESQIGGCVIGKVWKKESLYSLYNLGVNGTHLLPRVAPGRTLGSSPHGN